MSILIKGMEMPKGNDSIALFIYPDGVVVMYEMFGPLGRYTAVPVPPHGDLIERDAAYDKIAEQEGGNYVDMDAVDKGLNETPTIIPAEPPKEEER